MHHSDSIAASAVELLAKLVAFDSTSSNSNLSIIGFIEGYLNAYEIACTRIPSPDGSKNNLLARIGPDAGDGVILSGHTDVVPVAGQSWASDPFRLAERNGKYYGRGTADMKSFLAVCLAMVPVFRKARLGRPIWLAFSYDEEVGCLGAPLLLEHITHHVPKPAFAIIGEPTSMQVVTAHKGVLSFETTVHGHEWHSSQPHLGVNAVHIACDLVHFLHGLNEELAASGLKDARFNPPHTTVHVGVIHGGTARNIIPKACSFQWEIRPLPGDNPAVLTGRFSDYCLDMLKTIRRTYAKADIATIPMSHMEGVTLPPEAAGVREFAMHCAQTNREQVVSYGTEAGVFQHYGIPAVICGPGNIEQAHKPDEFIEHGQIHACVGFMFRLCDRLAGKTDT